MQCAHAVRACVHACELLDQPGCALRAEDGDIGRDLPTELTNNALRFRLPHFGETVHVLRFKIYVQDSLFGCFEFRVYALRFGAAVEM